MHKVHYTYRLKERGLLCNLCLERIKVYCTRYGL